jgi:Animal haem peroxidase
MATTHLPPARDHCLAPSRTIDTPLVYGGKYDRLFPELAPLAGDEALLLRLGYAGGPCDGGAWPDGGDPDDAGGAAGWPLFGQFVAHDITADRSSLQEHADPAQIRNFHTPRANLECLYGAGPTGSPFLYDRDDPAKLLLGENDAGRPDDLPRNRQGIALVGDPRNDVHLFMSQLHLAMLKLHNRLVDRLREDGVPEGALFDQASRAARWHYQWVIVHDFLPRVVGAELLADLLASGPRFYRPAGEPFIPFEFADAAYRYGHAQIRHAYRLNDRGGEYPMFPDLVGFQPVPVARVVDWSYLFELPGGRDPQRAKRIDGRLPRSLIELPREITGDVEVQEYHSLAVRDLQRGHALGLPSGEAVARRMAEQPLDPAEIGLDADRWHGETPLWFYLLKEADVRAGGERLGPVGGRIVAEVLLGIVDADPDSFRAVDPGWQPTLPAAEPGRFALADLLTFAASPAA